VNSEFNWWLLILGLVIGAGIVWLVLADSRRREIDVAEAEREGEARWIGDAMRDAGRRISDDDALDVLRLHDAYLGAPPPDELDEPDDEPMAALLSRAVTAAAEPRAPMAHRVASSDPVEPAEAADRATDA
jgi:hypothetical protein